ncbi:MAG TPA: hypothetical protein VEU47_18875 [Candidatus Cybelea sp.]|nr:hypothetical protein [Candidatus Cybelea sp.]
MSLPDRIDRMPDEAPDRISPALVIAIALTSCDERWAGRLLSETSRPVWTIIDALDKAGYKIVPKDSQNETVG